MNLQVIQNKIYEIRGIQVMLDFDLAELYQVETRILNQSVKRNIKRFPLDFMFQLNEEEFSLVSQFVIPQWKTGSYMFCYMFVLKRSMAITKILSRRTLVIIFLLSLCCR